MNIPKAFFPLVKSSSFLPSLSTTESQESCNEIKQPETLLEGVREPEEIGEDLARIIVINHDRLERARYSWKPHPR